MLHVLHGTHGKVLGASLSDPTKFVLVEFDAKADGSKGFQVNVLPEYHVSNKPIPRNLAGGYEIGDSVWALYDLKWGSPEVLHVLHGTHGKVLGASLSDPTSGIG